MVFVGHAEVYCKLFVCQALQHLAVDRTGTEFLFALPEVYANQPFIYTCPHGHCVFFSVAFSTLLQEKATMIFVGHVEV